MVSAGLRLRDHGLSKILGCNCSPEFTLILVIECLPPRGISSSSIVQTRRGGAGTRGERETFIFKVPPGRLPPPPLSRRRPQRRRRSLGSPLPLSWSMCVCSATCPRTDGRAEREAAGSERASDGFFSSDVRPSVRRATADGDSGSDGGGGGSYYFQRGRWAVSCFDSTCVGTNGARYERRKGLHDLYITCERARSRIDNGNLNGRISPGMTSLSLAKANPCGSAYAVENGFIDSYDLSFDTTLSRKWMG